MEMFYVLNHWHWWALATLLLAAELLTPSAWFLALSISALIVGAVSWGMPELDGMTQLIGFLLLGAVSVSISLLQLRKRARAHQHKTEGVHHEQE